MNTSSFLISRGSGDCPFDFGIFPYQNCYPSYIRCAFGQPRETPCEVGLVYDHRIHTCNYPDLQVDLGEERRGEKKRGPAAAAFAVGTDVVAAVLVDAVAKDCKGRSRTMTTLSARLQPIRTLGRLCLPRLGGPLAS